MKKDAATVKRVLNPEKGVESPPVISEGFADPLESRKGS